MTHPITTGTQTMAETTAGPWEADSESYGCPECGLYSCICYEDDDHTEEDDLLDGCGMIPGGFCMLAGTEFCDWDCPRTAALARVGQP